jgi:polysaccharide biosynthesis protein PslH
MATILTIIPYSFYPPTSGGALRCFYILREMARLHKVYVLTSQSTEDFKVKSEPPFPENAQIVSFFDAEEYSSEFKLFPKKIVDALSYRLLRGTFKGPVNNTLLKSHKTLKRLLLTVKFDVIYYENLEALGLYRNIIKRKNASAIHLYDAHNVDSELWKQLAEAEQKPIYRRYAEMSLAIESSLFKRVDAFFCCSETDNIILTKLNGNRISGKQIPNGVDLSYRPFDNNEKKYIIQNILFCGSLNYFPNKEGLEWFYNKVLPIIQKELPDIVLTVVGNKSDTMDYKFLQDNPNIALHINVESVVPYYLQSSVAIVPLLSGSGTRLKVLEAMSMGSPVVSTDLGAEGLNFVQGKHLLIAANPEEFANHVLNLLRDKFLFNTIRYQAFEYVKETYDWTILGKSINLSLDQLIVKKHDA